MPTVGNGYVGLKKETSFGEAVAADKFIPVKSFEASQDPQNYYPEAIRGNRGKGQGIPMGIQNEASSEMDAEPESLGHYLLAVLGSVTSTANAGFAGSFDHSFVPAGVLPSYTLESYDGFMTRQLAGSKCDSLTLSVEAGGDGVLTVSTEWRVKSVIDKATPSVPSYTDKRPFAFHRVTVLKGATPNNNFKSFEMEISNNLKDDQFTLSTSREVQSIDEGMREVTGSYELLFKNKADYLAFAAGTEEDLKITFEGDTLGASVKEKLVIEFPRLLADSFDVPMGGPDDEVLASVEFTALISSVAGYEVKATLTNLVTSY